MLKIDVHKRQDTTSSEQKMTSYKHENYPTKYDILQINYLYTITIKLKIIANPVSTKRNSSTVL